METATRPAPLQSRNAFAQVPDSPAASATPASAPKSFYAAAPSLAAFPPSDGGSMAANGSGVSASEPLATPKKQLDSGKLRQIRELLLSPGGCNLKTLRLEVETVKVIKERYLISSAADEATADAAAKCSVSYRHLIDLSSARLKCTDVFTEEHFLCKIINEPLHKVQLAYFKLQQDEDGCCSRLHGHNLIRRPRDIAPLTRDRTYVIIPAAAAAADGDCIYEDLHTYMRRKKRLPETEARALFYQICQTVEVCHRNGIILRDLKLKRFYFIDAARTKLQYESLEGSMILDDPEDDTLSNKIGCPLYTAPELLCTEPTYQGRPADMWSLGVILYTLLVGQYPFYEKPNCSLIRVIRHGQLQLPSSLSRSVRFLLLNLLRKNHAERIRADYIFLSPWLRQQQLLFVPMDVVIPDDDDDDDVGAEATSQPLDYSTKPSNDVEMG